MRDESKYRNCVGAVIMHKGMVLAGSVNKGKSDNGKIGMPQGGVEVGEDFNIAIYREIEEETGIKKDSLHSICSMPHFIYYDIPKEFNNFENFIGQKQKWYFFEFKGKMSEIDPNQQEKEFNDLKWHKYEDIIENCIFFKTPIYEEIFDFIQKTGYPLEE